MDLRVYATRDGLLVLVPDPCLPPREAEATFGPLTLRGRVRADPLNAGWAGILAQVERHLFATVSADVGLELSGLSPGAPGA